MRRYTSMNGWVAGEARFVSEKAAYVWNMNAERRLLQDIYTGRWRGRVGAGFHPDAMR